MKKYIIVFCDPGIDDTIALMYVLLNPLLELVAVVTSYGNVTQAQATINASYVLHLAGMSHVPVIPAACVSIAERHESHYPDIHGVSGLGLFTGQGHFPGNIHTFDHIRTLAAHYKRDLYVVELGRMTSLALALNVFQKEFRQIGGVYIMGGAFFMPGNRTAVAEANVYGDSIAAKFVLDHTEAVIAPLNVTSQATLSTSLVNLLANHPLFGNLFQHVFFHYQNYYSATNPSLPEAPIHDLLPVTLLHNQDIATFIKRDVTVVTKGEAKGMTIADLRPSSKAGHHHICWTINQTTFHNEVTDVFQISYTS